MRLIRPVPTRSGLLLLALSSACASGSSDPSSETNTTASSSTGVAGVAPSSAGGAGAPAANGAAGGSGAQTGRAANTAGSSTASAATNSTVGAAGSGNSGAATSGSPGVAGTSAAEGPASNGAAGSGAPGAAGSNAPAEDPAGNTAGSAPTPPAAGTGAPSPTGCQGSLCESFEASSGETLDPNWEVSTMNCMGTGTVSMDSSVAHEGSRSVRVNGGGGYCNHVFFRPKMSPWMAGQPVYARFFVRFEKALTQSHVTFLALHDESEMKDLRMGGQSEILMWNRESDDATLPELSPTGIAMSAKPEPGSWLCVEFLLDGQAPKLETWVNGEPVAGLIVEGEPTPDVDAQWQRKADWRPTLSDIRFGWESYGSDENTLWFDDVVLGSSRVGCEQ